MRKLLMGSVAMAGASALATGAAAMPIQSMSEEGTPILTAGMAAQFEAGFADSSAGDESTRRDAGFVNGRFAELYFNGELTADNGLTYGAKIHVNTTDRSTNITSGYPGRHYIYLKGDWGSMEFGNWIGADSGLNLCLLACTYKGFGGLDTPYKSYRFTPDGAIDNHINPYWFDQSPKATYYTPVVGGFQAGVSYTPTTSNRLAFFGQTPGPTSLKDNQWKDVIGYGLQWNGEFGGTGVAFSFSGAQSDEAIEKGADAKVGLSEATAPALPVPEYKAPTADKVWQGVGYYEIGGVVRHAGFQFGGTWWDAGEMAAAQNQDQDYAGWALDAAYSFGPYGVELQYAHAEIECTPNCDQLKGDPQTSEFNGWALQLGYSVAPGLKWYGELAGGAWTIDGKEDTSTVGLTGLYLSF